MRTFGSLLKAGYEPKNFTWLFKKNEEEPYIQFCRYNYGSGNKRTPIYKPYHLQCRPDELYLHPYFPHQPIVAVQILKAFPFGKVKMVHHLEKGILTINANIKFSEVDIYNYPTFFKPIYKNY